MFKAIFEGLASTSQSSTPAYSSYYNAPTSSGKTEEDPKKKIDVAALRGDIYKAMDLTHNWMVGRSVGDGVGYRAILEILTPHLAPFVSAASFQVSLTADELPVTTALLTNTIFLYSSLDGHAMPGAMALSSWADRLVDAYQRAPPDDGHGHGHGHGDRHGGRQRVLGDGIVRGLTERTEPSLATREFAAKVQIVGALKNVNAAVYGKGSTEARNADAILGSKFI